MKGRSQIKNEIMKNIVLYYALGICNKKNNCIFSHRRYKFNKIKTC